MSADKFVGIEACVFDAYGTLFGVHAPVASVAGQIGDQADAVSNLWRQKQLQYTWLRSLMGALTNRIIGFIKWRWTVWVWPKRAISALFPPTPRMHKLARTSVFKWLGLIVSDCLMTICPASPRHIWTVCGSCRDLCLLSAKLSAGSLQWRRCRAAEAFGVPSTGSVAKGFEQFH